MDIFRKIKYILTRAERKNALALLGLMVVGMALETLGIGLFIPAITLLMQSELVMKYPVVAPAMTALGNPSQQVVIVGGMLVLVLIYLIKTLYLSRLIWWQTRFAFAVQRRLSQHLFTTYLFQPYTFHLQRNSAQLINNATGEVGIFTYKTLLPGMLLLTESLVMVGIGSLLLMMEPVGTIIVALVLGGVSWGFHLATRSRILRWGQARQRHEGQRIQHLQQGLGGIKEVKLHGRESFFLQQYEIHNAQSALVGGHQVALQQLPRLWLELLAVSGMAILVLSMLTLGRDMTHVVPTLGLFAIAAFRLAPSMSRVLGAVQALRFGLPVINTLHDELSLQDVPPATTHYEDGIALKEDIQFNGVSYTYPGAHKPAVHDLSIHINKGETVGFIGASGAGKSTLVDILLGLLIPDTGKVTVDGINIQSNLRDWQNHIGYVPQSIYLTDDSLRRNVAFGLHGEQIDEAEVWRAIRAAQLDEFVKGLPDGLETVVGERGVRLSGGQRQRIGIARALYHDPEVLVLDEATSALDADTESEVMQAVRLLRRNKTVVIVAHRLSTVEQCDRLYRLDQGRIVKEGKPEMVLPLSSF